MIGFFLYSYNSDVGLDVFKTVVGFLKYLTRTMISSGFWNSLRMYFFRFLLNLLYLSLASICSDVVPKTAPKLSTSPLKFLIDDVHAGRLKLPPRPPRTWWPPLIVWPPWPRPLPPLLELNSLVSAAQVIVASLLSQPLIPVAGEAVSVSVVIVVYSYFLNTLTIKVHFIRFTSITALFDNYENVRLCPTWNKYKSVSLTVFRKWE